MTSVLSSPTYPRFFFSFFVFQAVGNVKSLEYVHSKVRATDGEKGRSKDCDGRCGEHTFVDVPVGTLVKTEDGRLLADLSVEGAMYVGARGGSGGRGNHFYASDTCQAPAFAQVGAAGEVKRYKVSFFVPVYILVFLLQVAPERVFIRVLI